MLQMWGAGRKSIFYQGKLANNQLISLIETQRTQKIILRESVSHKQGAFS